MNFSNLGGMAASDCDDVMVVLKPEMTKNSFSMKLTAPIAINKTYITLGF